jgi:hypothetical protein
LTLKDGYLATLSVHNQICLALFEVILFIVSLASLRAILNLLAGACDLEE